jgi:hypothetical protein
MQAARTSSLFGVSKLQLDMKITLVFIVIFYKLIIVILNYEYFAMGLLLYDNKNINKM